VEIHLKLDLLLAFDHLFLNLVMIYLECLHLNLFLEVDLRPMAV
jgi:hypothetical protein